MYEMRNSIARWTWPDVAAVFAIVVFVLLTTSYIIEFINVSKDKRILKERGVSRWAVVSDVYDSKSGRVLKYWFYLNGTFYHESARFLQDKPTVSTGDTLEIKYDPKDPNVSLPTLLLQ